MGDQQGIILKMDHDFRDELGKIHANLEQFEHLEHAYFQWKDYFKDKCLDADGTEKVTELQALNNRLADQDERIRQLEAASPSATNDRRLASSEPASPGLELLFLLPLLLLLAFLFYRFRIQPSSSPPTKHTRRHSERGQLLKPQGFVRV